MKKFRRMMALLLAMVMVLSMGISAFAAGEGEGEGGETPAATVTITNGEYDDEYYEKGAEEIDYAKHTYKAAQILKAEGYEDEEYTGLSWGAQVTDPAALLTALQGDETWRDTFANYVTVAAEGKTLFTAASFAKAISTANADQAKALAQVLKGLYAGQGTEITGTDPVALPGIGYYLIDDTTTSLKDDAANPVILAAVPGSNKIRIKADKPKQDKVVKENVKVTGDAAWNEVSDYNIGDYVPYKITSKVPNADAYKNYTMTFTDQMSDGLTFANSIEGVADTYKLKVTVGDTVLASTQYTLTPTDAQNFKVELPIKANGTQSFNAGDAITIEFYALLNENAEIGLDGNPNKSKLTYNNNPDVDNSKTDTPWDTVITFTYELDVNKIDGATKYALPGAQFALKAASGEHNGKYVEVDANGKITGWADAAPAADATDNAALLVADAEGNFKVIGLDDGTYTLEEIKAPAGYNPIQPITLVVKGTTQNGKDYTDDLEDTAANALTKLELDVTANGKTTTKEGDTTTGVVETTVENNSGATLPETGGMGTTLFYIVGAALVIGAGVVLVSRRRMGAN